MSKQRGRADGSGRSKQNKKNTNEFFRRFDSEEPADNYCCDPNGCCCPDYPRVLCFSCGLHPTKNGRPVTPPPPPPPKKEKQMIFKGNGGKFYLKTLDMLLETKSKEENLLDFMKVWKRKAWLPSRISPKPDKVKAAQGDVVQQALLQFHEMHDPKYQKQNDIPDPMKDIREKMKAQFGANFEEIIDPDLKKKPEREDSSKEKGEKKRSKKRPKTCLSKYGVHKSPARLKKKSWQWMTTEWGPNFEEKKPVTLQEFLENFPLNKLYYETPEGQTVLSNLEKAKTDSEKVVFQVAPSGEIQVLKSNPSFEEAEGEKPFWTRNNLGVIKMLQQANFNFSLAQDDGAELHEALGKESGGKQTSKSGYQWQTSKSGYNWIPSKETGTKPKETRTKSKETGTRSKETGARSKESGTKAKNVRATSVFESTVDTGLKELIQKERRDPKVSEDYGDLIYEKEVDESMNDFLDAFEKIGKRGPGGKTFPGAQGSRIHKRGSGPKGRGTQGPKRGAKRDFDPEDDCRIM